MKKKTNHELVNIVLYEHADYKIEALTAAKNEISLRKIDLNTIQTNHNAKEKNFKSQISFSNNNSNIKWLLIAVFPFVFLTVSLIEIFDVFLLPFALLSFIPCGLISYIGIRRERKNVNSQEVEQVDLVYVSSLVLAILTFFLGLVGLYIIALVTMM